VQQPTPAARPTQPVTPPPAQINREGNPPVVALLDSAATHVNSGQWDKAAASLERALRIEPRNAGIWHDLAQVRLQQRQYQQAESLAAKSNSLSGGNKGVRARNWRLIAVARRAAGNSSGADAAEAQATMLER
jgi:Tfp pilus assembly protein PilF